MRHALVLMLLVFVSQEALAHDYWKTGRAVDPQTKKACCGADDTKEIDPSLVIPQKGGFFLMDTREFIPFERVQPSPDNAIWVSRWTAQPTETKCFFYPMSY